METAVNDDDSTLAREERLLERMVSTSASMTGVCVALLSVVQIIADSRKTQTLADDALAIDSLFFLLCCYLAIWALRTHQSRRLHLLSAAVDYLFLIGMSGLVGIGFMIVYSIV
jgi:branched-subunit amino acid permease